MKAQTLFEAMATNYINGNHSDFKKQVSRLNKTQLVQFIQYLHGYFPSDVHAIINYLASR